MQENELKENEVEETVEEKAEVVETTVEETAQVQDAAEKNEVKSEEKPKRDWGKFNLGTKSKDLALLTFFGSTFIRTFSEYFAESRESQKLFISIYVYVPGILAVLGLIIGIIGLIKTKEKWNSAIGILINIFLIVSSVSLVMQMKQAGY